MRNYLIILVLALTIIGPFVMTGQRVAMAQEEVGPPDQLVPCTGFEDCDYQKFLDLIGKVFRFLVMIAVPLATLGIGIGGVYMIFGSASESERTKGKEIFWDSIIGLVIVVAAWLIVRTILIGLGADVASPNLLKILGK